MNPDHGPGPLCGHDHYNNYSLEVTETVYYNVDDNGIMIPVEVTDGATAANSERGTVRLTYGMSIDYLAYVGIASKVEQRGGTEIRVALEDGSISLRQRPLVSLAETANAAFV